MESSSFWENGGRWHLSLPPSLLVPCSLQSLWLGWGGACLIRGECCWQALTLQPHTLSAPPAHPLWLPGKSRVFPTHWRLGGFGCLPQTSSFFAFFLAEPHFSVGSPFFDVLEKVDMSAVFHFHAPLPLHKSAVYSMSKFIYGVERGALSNNGPDPSPKSFSRWLLLNVTGFFFWLEALGLGRWWGWYHRAGSRTREKSFLLQLCENTAPSPLPHSRHCPALPESGICWSGILWGEVQRE